MGKEITFDKFIRWAAEFQNEELQQAIGNTKLSRFSLSHYSLYLYGLCSKCDRANKRKKKSNNHKKEK